MYAIRDQRGMTLIELVVVAAIVSLAVTMTVVLSAPFVARESMRSAANNIHASMQLTKIEAVSRNRDCRFVIDTSDGSMEVWDSMGTSDASDDVRLHTSSIPGAVRFARPDTGDVVTLAHIAGTESYESVFGSDGMVSDGVGAVFVQGGDGHGNVEVHVAGGLEIHYWNGSEWQDAY